LIDVLKRMHAFVLRSEGVWFFHVFGARDCYWGEMEKQPQSFRQSALSAPAQSAQLQTNAL